MIEKAVLRRAIATMSLACGVLLMASTGRAQEPYNLTAPVHSLSTLFTDLYGPHGLVVDSLATLPGEQPHSAHFTSSFQSDFSQFNTALVGALVSVPLPSPASGFTYRFDPSLGVFQRTTTSFSRKTWSPTWSRQKYTPAGTRFPVSSIPFHVKMCSPAPRVPDASFTTRRPATSKMARLVFASAARWAEMVVVSRNGLG